MSQVSSTRGNLIFMLTMLVILKSNAQYSMQNVETEQKSVAVFITYSQLGKREPWSYPTPLEAM